MEDKIITSNLYRCLNIIDLGEMIFNNKEEELIYLEELEILLSDEKSLLNHSLEQIKYSLNILKIKGYSYLIEDYLNISDENFKKLIEYRNYLENNNPDIEFITSVDIKYNNIDSESVNIDILYDYLFCKYCKEIKENIEIDIKGNNVLNNFNKFKKKYK